MIVYTIGYGQLSTNRLQEIADGLDLTVVDVRGNPTSRRPGFGRRQLERQLASRYQWRGDQLGGVAHLKDAKTMWPDGLAELVREVARPLLLCQCHAPGACHRHQLAKILADDGHKVVHVFEHELIMASELERSIVDDDDYSYDAPGAINEIVNWEAAL